MDDSIAPTPDQGGDPIQAYRQYLAQQSGGGAGPDIGGPEIAAAPQDEVPNLSPPVGEGPDIAPPVGAPPPGAGPDIGQPPPQDAPQAGPAGPQAPPQAAPQSAEIAPSSGGGSYSQTPTIDSILPNPLQGPQGEAPLAAQAPQAKKAAKAKSAPQAAQAAQAAQAPTIDGQAQGQPDLGDAAKMTPASGHVIPGKTTADGKKLIGVHPPDHSPDKFWDKDKLATAQSPTDLVDSIKPGELTPYMDWWEKQHGDINQRYDQMRSELGQRPDPNREPTRKEQFTELLHFGLHLMQNNRRGTGPNGGAPDAVAAMGQSVEQTLDEQKGKQRQDTSDYDARVAGVEGQRQTQLKDLGNYGQAVREDATINLDKTRQAIAVANQKKPPRPPTLRDPARTYDTAGVMRERIEDPQDENYGKYRVPVDADTGKPLGPQHIVGPRGGSAAGGSKQVENIKFLESRGYSTAEATGMVMHVKPTGDPEKDYVQILNKNTPPGAAPDEIASARQAAEDTVNHLYGDGALDQARARRNRVISGPAKTPPATLLPPGKIGTDAQGNKWKTVNGKNVPAA